MQQCRCSISSSPLRAPTKLCTTWRININKTILIKAKGLNWGRGDNDFGGISAISALLRFTILVSSCCLSDIPAALDCSPGDILLPALRLFCIIVDIVYKDIFTPIRVLLHIQESAWALAEALPVVWSVRTVTLDMQGG